MKDKNTKHGKKFNFNKDVTKCFSNMLERSIPQYDLMRKLTNCIIEKYILENSIVLDIGTSTGEVIYKLSKKYIDAKFIGFENSDSMIEEAKLRFKDSKNVFIVKHDLRNKLENPILNDINVDIIISCLTIQFTPIEYRLKILKNIFDILNKNGIFIFIEKIIGSSAQIDENLVDIYYDIKRENGYSESEIQRKKLSLEGILVPVTASWNQELLKMSGFTQIDCFWRCLNFCGWIAIK